jgi:hypothetical protein
MLPEDITKRTLVKNALQEALKYNKEKELADSRLKDVFDSIKDSEDATGFSLAEFKEAFTVAKDYTKAQEILDKKQAAIDVVDLLKV